MAYQILNGSTGTPLLFLMVQSSDHISALTGATPTVTISKNGAAFASPSGTVTEIANGWYKVAGNATDTGTNGPLALHATAASGDPTDLVVAEIVAYNPQDAVHLGLSSLPNTAVTTNASLLTSGTSTDQISVSSGKVLLQATQSGVTIPTVTTVTNQLTAAAIATGIWQDTTAGDFTTASSIGKSLFTSGVVPGGAGGLFIAGTNAATTITTGLTTTFTGNLTGSVASVTGAVGSVTGLTASNLDTTVSSRMATYTQPTGFLAATFPTTVASPTNITAGTITTTTNLTNAPTSGDFTSTMKTSLNAATPASVVGAVGSVTGNVGGNVTGSVGSVAGNVSGSVASVVAAVAITSNRKKGATATFEFTMTDSTTGADKTGLTVASVISKDGGSFANTSNSVTETGDGWYQLVLTSGEMGANNIALQMTATGATARDLSIQTQP